MQNDLGRSLRVADALALVYRQARDEHSLTTAAFQQNDRQHAAAHEQKNREREIKEAAKNLNPALRHLFT